MVVGLRAGGFLAQEAGLGVGQAPGGALDEAQQVMQARMLQLLAAGATSNASQQYSNTLRQAQHPGGLGRGEKGNGAASQYNGGVPQQQNMSHQQLLSLLQADPALLAATLNMANNGQHQAGALQQQQQQRAVQQAQAQARLASAMGNILQRQPGSTGVRPQMAAPGPMSNQPQHLLQRGPSGNIQSQFVNGVKPQGASVGKVQPTPAQQHAQQLQTLNQMKAVIALNNQLASQRTGVPPNQLTGTQAAAAIAAAQHSMNAAALLQHLQQQQQLTQDVVKKQEAMAHAQAVAVLAAANQKQQQQAQLQQAQANALTELLMRHNVQQQLIRNATGTSLTPAQMQTLASSSAAQALLHARKGGPGMGPAAGGHHRRSFEGVASAGTQGLGMGYNAGSDSHLSSLQSKALVGSQQQQQQQYHHQQAHGASSAYGQAQMQLQLAGMQAAGLPGMPPPHTHNSYMQDAPLRGGAGGQGGMRGGGSGPDQQQHGRRTPVPPSPTGSAGSNGSAGVASAAAAAAASKEQRRLALACVALKLARGGINVEQAINSGIMGGMSVTDVRFIVECFNAERERIRTTGVNPGAGAAVPAQNNATTAGPTALAAYPNGQAAGNGQTGMMGPGSQASPTSHHSHMGSPTASYAGSVGEPDNHIREGPGPSHLRQADRSLGFSSFHTGIGQLSSARSLTAAANEASAHSQQQPGYNFKGAATQMQVSANGGVRQWGEGAFRMGDSMGRAEALGARMGGSFDQQLSMLSTQSGRASPVSNSHSAGVGRSLSDDAGSPKSRGMAGSIDTAATATHRGSGSGGTVEGTSLEDALHFNAFSYDFFGAPMGGGEGGDSLGGEGVEGEPMALAGDLLGELEPELADERALADGMLAGLGLRSSLLGFGGEVDSSCAALAAASANLWMGEQSSEGQGANEEAVPVLSAEETAAAEELLATRADNDIRERLATLDLGSGFF